MKSGIGKRIVAFAMATVMACSVNVVSAVADDATDVIPARIVKDGGTGEIPNTNSSFSKYNASFLSVNGYASEGIHDRNEYVDTDYYRQVDTPAEFIEALYDAQAKNGAKVKVIEIMKDLNLGYNYASNNLEDKYNSDSEMNQNASTKDEGALLSREKNVSDVCTNPMISESGGVTRIQIKDTTGLTIFSQYGATLNHTQLDIQSTSSDIVIRNIGMDGIWQWDNTGHHKESGITFIKVNGAKDVWVDHCSFTMAQDGLIDLENGANGVTLSWCKIGIGIDEALDNENIVASINYMETLYQRDKEIQQTNPDAGFTYSNVNMSADWASYSTPYDADGNELTETDIKAGKVPVSYVNGGGEKESIIKMRYPNMREAGWTVEEIMQYTAYHSKVHLTGSGDKDWETNAQLEISLGYNWYQNIAQRVPMIRQGRGHVYNCYIDDMDHMKLEAKGAKSVEAGGYGQSGNYRMSRCINPRNGASIAADTCVFYGINDPLIGSESQKHEGNSNFANVYNHALIVNSRTTNTDGATYEGSSWDNEGINQFTRSYGWYDKSTIGKWSWRSTITTKLPASGVYNGSFNFSYDYEEELPYSYQLVPLEDVEAIVKENAGMGAYDMTPEQWTRTTYRATEDIQAAGENKVNIASKVEIVEETPVVYVGDTIKLNVVTTPLNVTDPVFSWESTGIQKKRVSVDSETGEIKALQTGNVTIKVTCKSINGTVVSGSTTLKILEAEQKPIDPNVTDDAVEITGGAGIVTEDSSDVTDDSTNVTEDSVDVTDDGISVTNDSTHITDDGCDVPTDDSIHVTGDGVEVSEESADVTPGDITLDGKVDLFDAQTALRAALGIGNALTGSALVAADIDGEEGVDLRDAQMILKLALGIPVEFPKKETQTKAFLMFLKRLRKET